MDKTFIPVGVPNLQRMHSLALKHVFDKTGMTPYEEMELDIGIDKWVHRPDLTPWDKLELNRIINALIADEQGYFHRAKWICKNMHIDYRNLYKAGLPYVNCNPNTF